MGTLGKAKTLSLECSTAMEGACSSSGPDVHLNPRREFFVCLFFFLFVLFVLSVWSVWSVCLFGLFGLFVCLSLCLSRLAICNLLLS